jgi:hypothetical protein
MILTAVGLPLPVSAGPPKLKEGLWEIRGQSVESPGDKHADYTYKLCRDHGFDKATNAALKDVKGCSTVVKDQGGGSVASSSTCAVNGITIVSTGLTLYKSDSVTHSETHATYTPAFNGKTEETMTQDQQYVGKCPAGMKPGDRIAPDGILIRHHGS